MGYAGYAPGTVVKDRLSPLQQALRAMPLASAPEALELIERLTRNVVRNPGEEKFRRVKLSNPKITAAIRDVPFAVDVLKEMGWVQASEADTLELPPAVRLAHEKEVVAIIDAKDHYKKEEEAERRRQAVARRGLTEEQEALRRQLEADRKEKIAEGPVTKSSRANALGNGANIVRASDLGIGQGGG